ncbi:cAMP-regulated D2 protein-like isoform X2 [Mercenaria mercenaria]|nr:cAMP-regulated D2 protein-like isoform X2 [Mercenaria mercenaria]
MFGDVRGTRTDKALQFLGIPYAKPPTGDLRWRSPESPAQWSPDIYNATTRPPGCPQKYCTKYLPDSGCPTETSEDCLYLNVWTPLEGTNTMKYPVMVFFHGGAFKWGYPSAEVYDGNNIVSHGEVVLVTVAYRIGLLGFLYTGDREDDCHGNYGIQDQRLALNWVRENIQNFGGDPGKVMAFGESAGAQSVFIHMLSPKSYGLFQSAAVQSAPFGIPYRTKLQALGVANAIYLLLGCFIGDVKCLRSKSVEEIDEAQEKSMLTLTSFKVINYFEPIGPIIDEDENPLQPMEALRKNKVRNIPTILGTLKDEGRMFIHGILNTSMPPLLYEAALGVFKPSHFFQINREYPLQEGVNDLRDTLGQLATDYLFTCSNRNVSRLRAKDNMETYRFVFEHAAEYPSASADHSFCEGHVCHAAELPYLFGNFIGRNVTEDEIRLSREMMTYWTNFAHTSNPNYGMRVPDIRWPTYEYQTSKKATMHFITPRDELIESYRDDFCDFWDTVEYEK